MPHPLGSFSGPFLSEASAPTIPVFYASTDIIIDIYDACRAFSKVTGDAVFTDNSAKIPKGRQSMNYLSGSVDLFFDPKKELARRLWANPVSLL